MRSRRASAARAAIPSAATAAAAPRLAASDRAASRMWGSEIQRIRPSENPAAASSARETAAPGSKAPR